MAHATARNQTVCASRPYVRSGWPTSCEATAYITSSSTPARPTRWIASNGVSTFIPRPKWVPLAIRTTRAERPGSSVTSSARRSTVVSGDAMSRCKECRTLGAGGRSWRRWTSDSGVGLKNGNVNTSDSIGTKPARLMPTWPRAGRSFP